MHVQTVSREGEIVTTLRVNGKQQSYRWVPEGELATEGPVVIGEWVVGRRLGQRGAWRLIPMDPETESPDWGALVSGLNEWLAALNATFRIRSITK